MPGTPGTVQHVVLFKFPEPLAADDERELVRQVRAWPERIGGFTHLRFGPDITGARNRGYQYLLFTQFADQETLQAYRTHPVHVAFADWVHARGCEELAFDYVLDDSTVVVDGD